MEARSVEAIPQGSEWQYEPKWDGFRCLFAFDLLVSSDDEKLAEEPLSVRPPALGLPAWHVDFALAPRQVARQCTFDRLKQKAANPMKLLVQ